MAGSIRKMVEDRKIVDLDDRQKAVFVGDTHGDFEASKRVWERFGSEVKSGETYLVFLGDYVDRGNRSKDNIDFLLSKKEDCSDGVVLLLGNHDAYGLRNLRPADFWQSLDMEERDFYENLKYLPWMVRSDGLVASHGALPFLSDLEDLESKSGNIFDKENELGLPVWMSLTWGDINDSISGYENDPLTGRPQFGKDIIFRYLQKHDWDVLVRAHQPNVQGWAFDDNVLTIFTSQAYVQMGRARGREVAVVDLEREEFSRENFDILRLSEF